MPPAPRARRRVASCSRALRAPAALAAPGYVMLLAKRGAFRMVRSLRDPSGGSRSRKSAVQPPKGAESNSATRERRESRTQSRWSPRSGRPIGPNRNVENEKAFRPGLLINRPAHAIPGSCADCAKLVNRCPAYQRQICGALCVPECFGALLKQLVGKAGELVENVLFLAERGQPVYLQAVLQLPDLADRTLKLGALAHA